MSIRNLMRNVLTCVAMLIGTFAYAADKPDMQVLLFTDRSNEFTDDGGYPVIYLDEVLRIEEELTQAISHFDLSENMKPEELDKVRNQLRRVLDEQALLDAYAGLSLAWSLNVTHIPAIVTRIQGERYLVSYGEYDVPISLVRIRN
jgi:integrating conjugative element protein (TIGR03757 family)